MQKTYLWWVVIQSSWTIFCLGFLGLLNNEGVGGLVLIGVGSANFIQRYKLGHYKSFCRCPNLYWLYLTKGGGGRPEKMSLTGLGSHEKPNIWCTSPPPHPPHPLIIEWSLIIWWCIHWTFCFSLSLIRIFITWHTTVVIIPWLRLRSKEQYKLTTNPLHQVLQIEVINCINFTSGLLWSLLW